MKKRIPPVIRAIRLKITRFPSIHNQVLPVMDRQPHAFLKSVRQFLMVENRHQCHTKIQFYTGLLILQRKKPTVLQLG